MHPEGDPLAQEEALALRAPGVCGDRGGVEAAAAVPQLALGGLLERLKTGPLWMERIGFSIHASAIFIPVLLTTAEADLVVFAPAAVVLVQAAESNAVVVQLQYVVFWRKC